MGKETYSDHVKIEVAKERHFTLRVFFTGLFAFLVLSTAITSCTYYNVESVKHPIKYEQNDSTQYERK